MAEDKLGKNHKPKKKHVYKGRPPGHPNKMPRMLRELFLNVLEEAGGEGYILEFAKKDPKTFISLVSKMLPKEIHVEGVVGAPKSLSELRKMLKDKNESTD